MKKFFDYTLPLLFVLSLLPLCCMIIWPKTDMEQLLYCVYFALSLLCSANFGGYLSFKTLSRSYNKWSIFYIVLAAVMLMFNIAITMFVGLIF